MLPAFLYCYITLPLYLFTLARYELAEDHLARKKAEAPPPPPPAPTQRYDYGGVHSFVAQADDRGNGNGGELSTSRNTNNQSSGPDLPRCPNDWDGQGCWYHPDKYSHNANNCNALKEYQRRHLEFTRTSPANATPIWGYPRPGATVPAYWKNGNNSGGGQQQYGYQAPGYSQRPSYQQQGPSQQNGNGKRPICDLCEEPGHIVSECPQIILAKRALKKGKTHHANAATHGEDEDDSEVKPV